MPFIKRDTVDPIERQAYPGRLRKRTSGCWKRRLSDAAGLTQFGAGEVELAPGSSTGLYHWHQNEDEFVYILAGEVVMVEGETETLLRTGDCAGFPAGANVGHTFENRSGEPARLLEIGLRAPSETAYYPGLDMVYQRDGTSLKFVTRDGRELDSGDEVVRVSGDPDDLKPPSDLDID